LTLSVRSICRSALIGFFVFCFFLMQVLPVVAAFASGLNPMVSAGQEGAHSKKGCCCCKPPDCPCDMKKDQSRGPMDFDVVFPTRIGNHAPEDLGPLREPVSQNRPSETARTTHWVFARAPCPTIYLATLNLLC
jgi:hypothetical protein